MNRTDLDVLSFLAVFATFFGTLEVFIPAVQVLSHSTDDHSLISFLVGATMLIGSFLVLRAHDAHH
jgi:hypothetical protein